MGRPPQCDYCCPTTTSTTTTSIPTTTIEPTTTITPTTTPEPCVEGGGISCRYTFDADLERYINTWSSLRRCDCNCPSATSVLVEYWRDNDFENPADGSCADVYGPCCYPCNDWSVIFNNCPTTTTTTEGPTTTTTGSPTTTTTPAPYTVIYCRSTCDNNIQNSCFGGIYSLPISFSPSDCQEFSNRNDAQAFLGDLLTSTRAIMLPGDCNDSFTVTMIDSLCSNCPDEPCTTTTTSAPTTTTTTAAPTTTTTSGPTTTTTEGPTTTTTSGPTTTTTTGPTLPPATTTTTTIKPFACVICPADAPICVPVDDCSVCENNYGGGVPCITNCNLDELPDDFNCWPTQDPGSNPDPGDGGGNPEEDPTNPF